MKVYVIIGGMAMYDDYTESVEAVCASKRTADARCRKLNAARESDQWLGLKTYEVEGPFEVATRA